jgi:hypothetical protein
MKTVISASRRTDIPAFYLDWFIDRIRAGRVVVQNPVYKAHRYAVDLRPEAVEWIVFWSRNYKRFLERRDAFADYNLFFHFTIVSHHPQLERLRVSPGQSLKQIEKLATYYGPQRIIWRYDPIVIWQDSGKIHTNYSAADFKNWCRQLSNWGIRRCYFSFVSPYQKFLRRFNQKFPEYTLLAFNTSAGKEILSGLKDLAGTYGIELFSCGNDNLLDSQVSKGHCISGELLNRLAGESRVSTAKAPTRRDCGCTKSIDIGDYLLQPCRYDCIYCYAQKVPAPN